MLQRTDICIHEINIDTPMHGGARLKGFFLHGGSAVIGKRGRMKNKIISYNDNMGRVNTQLRKHPHPDDSVVVDFKSATTNYSYTPSYSLNVL